MQRRESADTAVEGDNLEARVEALEGEVRRLKGREQTARLPFALLDRRGRRRLEVQECPSGVSISLLDPEGYTLAAMVADTEAGGMLSLLAPDGRPLVALAGNEQQGGSVNVYTPAGSQAATLAGGDGGALVVHSADGKGGAALFGAADGGRVLIDGPAGERLAELKADSEAGTGVFVLLDRNGKPVFEKP